MNQENFTLSYLPMAQKAGERYVLNPQIILAQAALESAWGASYGARVRNNLFGIIAAGSANEFWDGSYSISQNKYALKFRVYKTQQDSFFDFARLIKQKYKAAHALSHDSKAYARAIAYSPYISEVNGDNRERYRLALIYCANAIGDIIKKKQAK